MEFKKEVGRWFWKHGQLVQDYYLVIYFIMDFIRMIIKKDSNLLFTNP